MNINKKIKIAWLHSHFLYWLGGTKFVYEVIKRLSKRYKITLFLEQCSISTKSKYEEIGVNVVIISDRSSNSLIYWLFFPLYLKNNLKFFKKYLNNYDVLVSSMFPMNWMTAHFKKPKIQYCYEPFAFFYDAAFIRKLPLLKGFLVKILAFIYQNLDIESVKKQDAILTLSEVTREQIKKVYGVDSEVTYEGVDVDFFSKKSNPEIEKRYKGYKLLIHSTDFTPIKGTDLIIRVMPRIVKEYPKTKLLITSTIENKNSVERLFREARKLGVRKNIEYLGFVDYELLPVYYSIANVLIHAGHGSSGATTMSLPVKEALACQTPVVRSLDTRDEVIDGISGYLVDPKSTENFSEAILKILRNSTKAELMGKRGREHVVSNFTWDMVVSKIESIIRSTIS